MLQDGNIDVFRQASFVPGIPGILPRGHFSHFPAVKSWFMPQEEGNETLKLNYDYLRQYGETTVPLELTRLSYGPFVEGREGTFQRFQAPLSLFLDWTQRATPETTDRLYLAQAQVMELPQKLRDDLPIPDLVAKAGKGDIYDINIWIGLAPTYTPLHRDPNPNLFLQLAGTKIVRLFEPEVGAGIFNRIQAKLGKGDSSVFRGEEMMKGEEQRLLEAEVWSEEDRVVEGDLEGYEALLEGGDALFIPQGWWHSVKGVGDGITGSVSTGEMPALVVMITDMGEPRSIGGSGDFRLSSIFRNSLRAIEFECNLGL